MKVKLLYPPRLNTTDVHQYMPRLGISMVYSTLKLNNVYAEQDDLAIKCLRAKSFNRSKINLNVFKNEDRVKKYLEGKHDSYLESVIQKILNLTKCTGFDIFGFS